MHRTSSSTPQAALINAGLDPTTQGARLRVKIPIGRAAPKAWRLRRASAPVRDPLAMNIVATGPVPALTSDGVSQSFELDATEPLKPWRQYRFAVEVQADLPPGAPTVGVIPAGEWSAASVPVTLAVIPPAGPQPASQVQIANGASTLNITVTHPHADSLIGTALGPHVFELRRCEPGQRPAKIDVAFARGAGSTWTGSAPGTAPAGTYASLRIIDPIGRRSDPCPGASMVPGRLAGHVVHHPVHMIGRAWTHSRIVGLAQRHIPGATQLPEPMLRGDPDRQIEIPALVPHLDPGAAEVRGVSRREGDWDNSRL